MSSGKDLISSARSVSNKRQFSSDIGFRVALVDISFRNKGFLHIKGKKKGNDPFADLAPPMKKKHDPIPSFENSIGESPPIPVSLPPSP